MDNKAAIARIKELAEQKRYAEARALLEKLDHPLRDSWLKKMDALIAKEKRQAAISGTYTAPKSRTAEQRVVSPAQPPERKEIPPAKILPAQKPKHLPGSNPFPTVAIIAGLLTIAIGGVGGGIVLFLSSKLMYLICMSPIIAAGIVGGVMGYILKMVKAHQPFAAAIFGVLVGLTCYASYRYAEYQDFLQSFRAEIVATYGEYEQSKLDAGIDAMLIEETGRSGFLGFVTMQAEEGMTVVSTRSTSQESHWTESATIGYWVCEILLFLIIPAVMAGSMTNEPFCEETNEWLQFVPVAGVAGGNQLVFMQLLNADQFGRAGELIKGDRVMGSTTLQVLVGRCSRESPEAIMRVEEFQGNNKKQILQRTVSAQQLNDFVAALKL